MPAGGGKATSFTCTTNYGSGSSPAPDGQVWACVRAADAAIPDNPSQRQPGGSADKANLSDPQCDGIVLDRAAPAAWIDASATAVKVGDLVSFEAQASDAVSGVAAGEPLDLGRQHRGRQRRVGEPHLHAGRHLRGEAVGGGQRRQPRRPRPR